MESDKRTWEFSRLLVGGILAFSSTALIAFLPLAPQSTAMTVAVGCFATAVPFAVAQLMDFYREDRNLYHMSNRVSLIVALVLMFAPFAGVCAALAYVSSWLCYLFVLSACIAAAAYSSPDMQKAKREQQEKDRARAQRKQPPAKVEHVSDPHENFSQQR